MSKAGIRGCAVGGLYWAGKVLIWVCQRGRWKNICSRSLNRIIKALPLQTHPHLTPLSLSLEFAAFAFSFSFSFSFSCLHMHTSYAHLDRAEEPDTPSKARGPGTVMWVTQTKCRETLYHQNSGAEPLPAQFKASFAQPGNDRDDSFTFPESIT